MAADEQRDLPAGRPARVNPANPNGYQAALCPLGLMPATPAWPPQSTPRLFVETALAHGMQLRVEGPQAHYLIAVMRMKPGDPVKLFDGESGEWLSRVPISACLQEPAARRLSRW